MCWPFCMSEVGDLVAWKQQSRRGQELPGNWDSEVRPAVRARAGGRCEEHMDSGARCPEVGTDCDHIGDPLDHRMSNLQWLCGWHHRAKTSRQGAEAQQVQRAKLTMPVGRHPGLR